MTRTGVTRFRDAVPVEVATRCGGDGCTGPDWQWIYGRGESLPDCLADLTTNFNQHVEAS